MLLVSSLLTGLTACACAASHLHSRLRRSGGVRGSDVAGRLFDAHVSLIAARPGLVVALHAMAVAACLGLVAPSGGFELQSDSALAYLTCARATSHLPSLSPCPKPSPSPAKAQPKPSLSPA